MNSCTNKCFTIGIVPNKSKKPYDNGLKYCCICAYYFICSGFSCPCCGKQMRNHAMNRKIGRNEKMVHRY